MLEKLTRFLDARRIAFRDLWTFLECPQAFLFRVGRAPRRANTSSMIGDVVHRFADTGRVAEARHSKRRLLAQVPREERAAVRLEVKSLVRAERTLATADSSTGKRDEQLFAYRDDLWWFPDWAAEALPVWLREFVKPSFWTFLIQVDQKSTLEDGSTQLVERKKGGTMQAAYKEQLFYSGMVLLMGRHAQGPVRLVVRLLRAARDVPFWYKPARRWEQLARWRKVVAEIEGGLEKEIKRLQLQSDLQRSGEPPTAEQAEALERVNFPPKPVGDGDWPCRECPWRHICPAKSLSLKQEVEVAAAATDQGRPAA
jgi:hypothetical protein